MAGRGWEAIQVGREGWGGPTEGLEGLEGP